MLRGIILKKIFFLDTGLHVPQVPDLQSPHDSSHLLSSFRLLSVGQLIQKRENAFCTEDTLPLGHLTPFETINKDYLKSVGAVCVPDWTGKELIHSSPLMQDNNLFVV